MNESNYYGSEVDPSMPMFRYSEAEKENMRLDGMTEEEIKEKEDIVNNKLAQKKLEAEQGSL